MRNTILQRELVTRTGPALRLTTVVVLMVVAAVGCDAIPITEPPTLPGAIRNFLDEPVDVYGYSTADPSTSTLMTRLDPGDLYEVESLDTQCTGKGVVALEGDVEVGRLDDRCAIDEYQIWVLHPEGNYMTANEGKDTYYPRD
jgi:hypothetical protein